MKKLFLASSINQTAKSIAKDIGKDPKKLKLAFISTAAEVEKGEMDWLDNDRNGLVKAGFNLFDYTITGKSQKEINKDLGSADIIHVNGGNTFYLLLQARKSGFDKWITKTVNKGRVYIGSSAGSIITGPKLPDYLINANEIQELKSKRGFCFVNFTIIPHWGSKDFKELYLNKRLKIAYKKNQVPFLLLTDTQYVKVEDDMYRIVDVRDK